MPSLFQRNSKIADRLSGDKTSCSCLLKPIRKEDEAPGCENGLTERAHFNFRFSSMLKIKKKL
ncbi:MAG: hypothetical protein CMI63_17765 [Parvularcula sp.]|nr:hypothetical protein [Parvularcula sp.]